jgi:hypothetical protein
MDLDFYAQNRFGIYIRPHTHRIFFSEEKEGKKKEIRVIDLISILNSMIIKYNNNK